MSGSRVTMKTVVLDMTKLSREKQQKYAIEFSEGSDDLRKLLLYMWQNGINTHACCAGHESQKMDNGIDQSQPPYILFDINKLRSNELKDLLSKLILLNETKDKPCLDISIQSQLFDREYFKNFIAEGRIEDDVFERHSMSIRFVDGNNTHYKELLDVLQSVKSQDKSLINKLKDKFKQVVKMGTKFKDFINIVSQVNEMSLKDNVGDKPFESIYAISLQYQKGELTQSIGYKRPNNRSYYTAIIRDGKGETREIGFDSAPGYQNTISIDGDIRHFVIRDDKAVEISQEESDRLYRAGINVYICFKDERYIDFSKEKMNKILESLNQEQTLIQ